MTFLTHSAFYKQKIPGKRSSRRNWLLYLEGCIEAHLPDAISDERTPTTWGAGIPSWYHKNRLIKGNQAFWNIFWCIPVDRNGHAIYIQFSICKTIERFPQDLHCLHVTPYEYNPISTIQPVFQMPRYFTCTMLLDLKKPEQNWAGTSWDKNIIYV